MVLLQTKGVRGVANIDINTAAWIAAVAAVGCAIVGSAALWPVMRRLVHHVNVQCVYICVWQL